MMAISPASLVLVVTIPVCFVAVPLVIVPGELLVCVSASVMTAAAAKVAPTYLN